MRRWLTTVSVAGAAALLLTACDAPSGVDRDLTDDWAITALAGIITMTPGTLTADVAEDRSYLLIHALHVDDAEAIVASIKTRYEAPLKEIYE